jgi:hypothetical protein
MFATFSVGVTGSKTMCDQIAKIRRRLQRIGTNHTLFLDETYRRIGDVQTATIVLPHEPSFINTSTSSNKSPRYDMIACISGTTAFPPIIFSPEDRDRGITTELLIDYIRNILAQAAGAQDVYPLCLYVDRSGIHNLDQMKQTFHDWGCQELEDIQKLPPTAAKRISPLDNALFNVWKQRVLQNGPLTKLNIVQRMSDAWTSFTKSDIQQQYRKCGLMRHQNVYFDCPNPAVHKHP